MIEPNKAVQAFKEKFGKMSYDEREQYLKKMGFSFGDKSAKRKSPIMLHTYRGTATKQNVPTQAMIQQMVRRKNLAAAIKVKD